MGNLTENNERAIVIYEETVNQQRIPSGQGLIGATPYWTQQGTPLLGIQGDAGADGTELIEINIPAGHVFVCSNLWYSCNEGRSIAICTVADTQVLGHASQAEVLPFGSDNKGFHGALKEQDPIFVVDNSASDVDIDLLLYAPVTVFNVANNPVTSWFQAFMSGLLYRGNVALKGTV